MCSILNIFWINLLNNINDSQFRSLCETMKFTCCLFFLALAISGSLGLKVLGILPFAGSSHFAIGNSIVKSLHEAGHDVTQISPFPKKSPVPKHRDIGITEMLEEFKKGKCKIEMKLFDTISYTFNLTVSLNMFDFHDKNPIIMLFFLYKVCINLICFRNEIINFVYQLSENGKRYG